MTKVLTEIMNGTHVLDKKKMSKEYGVNESYFQSVLDLVSKSTIVPKTESDPLPKNYFKCRNKKELVSCSLYDMGYVVS